MLDAYLRALFEQGREGSLVLYLLVDFIGHGYAFYKEWLVLGKTALRDRAAAETKDKALADVSAKLTDQRILNERATVIIDNLTGRVRDLELELARSEGEPRRERPRR